MSNSLLPHVEKPGSSVYEISRQGHLSGFLFPSPGGLPDPGIKPVSITSPECQADSLPLVPCERASLVNKLNINFHLVVFIWGFPGDSAVKNLCSSARNMGLIPGLRRFPGEGNGNPLHSLAWEVPWTEQPMEPYHP